MQQRSQEIEPLLKNHSTREEGFELLVREYQQEVYWLIRRMVLLHDDADDLTQETFLKVWKNLDNFRWESSLFTWIYRIAANESLAFLRKKKTSSLFFRSGIQREGMAFNDAFFRREETNLRFQEALLRLPDKQRLVFNMKYHDELSYEEISAVTGTSVGALKASFHQAVQKIRKFMTEI